MNGLLLWSKVELVKSAFLIVLVFNNQLPGLCVTDEMTTVSRYFPRLMFCLCIQILDMLKWCKYILLFYSKWTLCFTAWSPHISIHSSQFS